MRVLRLLVVVGILSMVTTPLAAQNFEIVGTYGSSYGPYKAWVDPSSFPNPGVLPGDNRIDVFCVDYLHRIYIGEEWNVHYTQVSDEAGINSQTMWGQYGDFSWDDEFLPDVFTAQVRYQQAAWLATQFTMDNTGEWRDIHTAMWHVFNHSIPTDPWGDSEGWWTAARLASNYQTVNMDYWHVITPDGQEGVITDNRLGQEYLTYVTPEPATIFLMGTGLVAVLGMTFVTRRSLG